MRQRMVCTYAALRLGSLLGFEGEVLFCYLLAPPCASFSLCASPKFWRVSPIQSSSWWVWNPAIPTKKRQTSPSLQISRYKYIKEVRQWVWSHHVVTTSVLAVFVESENFPFSSFIDSAATPGEEDRRGLAKMDGTNGCGGFNYNFVDSISLSLFL